MFASVRRQLAGWLHTEPEAAPTQPTLTVRRFEGASSARGWGERFGRVATETLAATSPLRARARYAYANNPYARAAVDALVTNLVGPGIRATPTHPEADSRTVTGKAVDRWANEAGIDDRSDWLSVQVGLVRDMVVDGEALLLLIQTELGLRLRQIPAEMLDESQTRELPDGGAIFGGVEFDAIGRRVAYWIHPERPTSMHATWAPSVRIDASDVLHIFRPLGAEQVRGVSWLAPVLPKLSDIAKLDHALLVGFEAAACFMGFITNSSDVSGESPFDGTRDGSTLTVNLAPGTLQELGCGQDIKMTAPAQAQQGPDFLSAQIRTVGVGMGVPAYLVSGDLSQANYGSLRADMAAFRQRLEQVQYGILVPQLLRKVHARAVTSLIFHGEIQAPDSDTRLSDWTGAEFIMPAVPSLDPAKDAAALRERIDAGLMSRRQAVAESGWSVEDLDPEIAADRAREKALGLSFGAAQPQKSEVPVADPAA